MNQIDPKQATRFILILAVIAVIINVTGTRRYQSAPETASVPTTVPRAQPVPQQTQSMTQTPSKPDADDVARKAAEEAAAAHAKYVAQYISDRPPRQAGVETVAIVSVDENGEFDPVVGDALANKFQSSSVNVVSGVFTQKFVTDGLFANLFDGSRDVITKLDLTDSLSAVVLAREEVHYVTNPSSLDNVLTANMRLEVTFIPTTSNSRKQTWAFTANGAGFKREDARSMAEQRLLKQLADDTRISPDLIPTTHQ